MLTYVFGTNSVVVLSPDCINIIEEMINSVDYLLGILSGYWLSIYSIACLPRLCRMFV